MEQSCSGERPRSVATSAGEDGDAPPSDHEGAPFADSGFTAEDCELRVSARSDSTRVWYAARMSRWVSHPRRVEATRVHDRQCRRALLDELRERGVQRRIRCNGACQVGKVARCDVERVVTQGGFDVFGGHHAAVTAIDIHHRERGDVTPRETGRPCRPGAS